MSLQILLAEVDPAWHGRGADAPDADLRARAAGSALGRRLLARALADGPAVRLLAPSPDAASTRTLMRRWNRRRLAALQRDLGTLAYAPAIRAEIGREPVRRLKAALGNGYLLALDRSVWDGKADGAVQAQLAAALADVLGRPGELEAALFPLLDLQGRAELQAWAAQRDPALAEWARLLDPPADLPPAHLPEKPVLVVHTHHQSRAVAA
ncbi:hypothetical protein ACF3M1_15725 [Luteimonas sp. WGS1318]|uniref:hypothetical protein n=1 Tax=Luteimonas sp. WGS1318 TaxID=3366815 RepID=UPI00372D3EAA